MARETWSDGHRRMACYDCGASGGVPVTTTRGENPGRHLRVCRSCFPRWDAFGLIQRERMGLEKEAPAKVDGEA